MLLAVLSLLHVATGTLYGMQQHVVGDEDTMENATLSLEPVADGKEYALRLSASAADASLYDWQAYMAFGDGGNDTDVRGTVDDLSGARAGCVGSEWTSSDKVVLVSRFFICCVSIKLHELCNETGCDHASSSRLRH